MLKKIKNIENIAVFKAFDWDVEVKESNGAIKSFQDINIFYGRNYSGKTTLSRIIRSLETSKLPENYVDPKFKLLFEGGAVSESQIHNHDKKIRVFNEDFIKENLKFITNPDHEIEPFAILGEDNANLEQEIENLESEIGSNVEGEETGLRKDLIHAAKERIKSEKSFKKNKTALDAKVNKKIRDRKTGIKYQSNKFGNQNYDIRDFDKDVVEVSKDTFEGIDNLKQQELLGLLDEKTLPEIPALTAKNIDFKGVSSRSKTLIERKVSESGKIKELVEDALLNKWVQEGRKLQKGKDKCSFCDGPILQDRWAKLDQHFDEEYENLISEIDEVITNIESEEKRLSVSFDKTPFYRTFHDRLSEIETSYGLAISNYHQSLQNLKLQLKKKQDNPVLECVFDLPQDFTGDTQSSLGAYETLRGESNKFSAELNENKSEARKLLRLREVADFADQINYRASQEEIDKLEKEVSEHLANEKEIKGRISAKEREIQKKKDLLRDEQKGADKVNEYLHNFLGHNSLSLDSINDPLDKSVRFQVKREGVKAFNLSEGECSLLAFCYFIARLDDTSTSGVRPIIWIDDPISSLDSNHIFFIYSLLKSEIVDKNRYIQLFLSTHNLDFLKYLKRLNGMKNKQGGGQTECQRAFFLIDRIDQVSTILPMPKYLKEYFTEFNFLFDQIYKCHEIERVTDENYTLFYNFGNNARKFLEIYLYYKYPDGAQFISKLTSFFGDKVPALFTDRINNEYSHLSGVFERGATPVEVPEMKKAADLIIGKLKEDKDQFDSLLKSIGKKPQKQDNKEQQVA